MRHLLGRRRSGEQGPTPSWLPIHPSLVPFVCGSFSGVMAIQPSLGALYDDDPLRLHLGLLSILLMCEYSVD